jgi:hypothetical protein
MITVKTPDGGTARFPDGTSRETITSALRKKFGFVEPKPEISWSEMPADIGASTLQGIRSGVEGLVGSIGDASKISGDIASWGAEKLGMSPDAQKIAESVGRRLPTLGLNIPAPTTSQVSDVVKDYIGPDYEPKSKTGEAFQSIGTFIPSAVTGPGGLIRRGAMAVVPGLAVEAAGEATGDNPYAETAAGIASGILTAGRGNAGTKLAIKNAPSAEEIGKKTNELYSRLRNAGVAYDNNAYAQFIDELQREMKNRGYRPRKNSPNPIAADIQELADAANNPLDFSEMESLRKSIGKNLPVNASNEDRAAAAFVREKFDDFLDSAPLITGGNISADQVGDITRTARELASRNIKNRIIEEAIEKAKDAASGFENGLRIEFRKIKANPKKFRGFSESEKEAITNIIRPSNPQNLLAQFGRLGISLDKLTAKASLLPTIVAGGGYAASSMLPAAAIVGSATGAKYAGRLMAEKSGRDLSALARTGRAEQAIAREADKIAKEQSRIRAGLTAGAATRPAREELVPLEIEIPGGDLPVSAAEEPAQQASGGRIARKSGGRTTGNPISAEVKRVRALLSEKTASMLSVPDDAIATALHLAKRT